MVKPKGSKKNSNWCWCVHDLWAWWGAWTLLCIQQALQALEAWQVDDQSKHHKHILIAFVLDDCHLSWSLTKILTVVWLRLQTRDDPEICSHMMTSQWLFATWLSIQLWSFCTLTHGFACAICSLPHLVAWLLHWKAKLLEFFWVIWADPLCPGDTHQQPMFRIQFSSFESLRCRIDCKRTNWNIRPR